MSHSFKLKPLLAGLPRWVALLASAGAASAWAAPTSCSRVDIAPVVKVSLGKSTIVRPTSPIQRIVLGSSTAPRAPDAAGAPAPVARYHEWTHLGPHAIRERLGDGNFAGLHQRPDDEMLAIWREAVEETRELIAGGWD